MKRRMWAIALMVMVWSLFLIGCDQLQPAADETADTTETTDTGAPDTGTTDDAATGTESDATGTEGDAVSDGTTAEDSVVDSATAAGAPVAIPDNFTVAMDTALTENVLTNDLDSSGAAINSAQVSVTAVTNPTNGTVQLNLDGSFTYQPAAGYVGVDLMRYRVCDNTDTAACSEADVTISVAEAVDVAGGDTSGDAAEGDAAGDASGDAAATGDDTAADTAAGTTDSSTAAEQPGAGGAAPTTTQAPGTVHAVKNLEWLIQIARCYGTTEQALLTANPWIRNRNLIYPDQQIAIPQPGDAGAITGPPCVDYYTVVAGDTTAGIAANYGIKESELMRINAIPTPNSLVAGRVLVIPKPVPPIMQP